MKIKKHTLFNIIAIILFLFTIMPLTLAWFSEKHDVDVTDLTGSSVASYFGGGSGTQTDPFIIATPEHLYNLAWLQNRHVLEEMNWDYFILDPEGTSDVLDMAGALSGEGTKTGAIPPIGTKENPFRGYFDGNSCVIENLWVSTDPSDWQEQPEEYLNEDYSYGVGLFGYLEKHETNPTYVGNFYLRNIEVTCSIQTDNLGLVAGYVNCSMNRIGVENGIFTFKNNCQVKSVYSLIGDIDSEVIWTDNPTKGGSGANGDLVINPTVDTSCQVGSGSKMPVLGANPGTAYYIGSLTRKDPNPQPKSFMRFNNSISFNGSKITYTANTSTTSTVTQTNVEESFYNLTRENGTKYSIIPNGQPNFANAASYNTYPTNGVWFQPYAGGTCVISFARQNNSKDEYYSLYRYKRNSSGAYDASTLQEVVFCLLKELGNGIVIYFELELTNEEAKEYEYFIANSSTTGGGSCALFYLKLAGTDITGGANPEDGTAKILNKFEFVNFNALPNFNSPDYNIDMTSLQILGTATTDAKLQYHEFTSDNKVHFYNSTGSGLTITENIATSPESTSDNNLSNYPTRDDE